MRSNPNFKLKCLKKRVFGAQSTVFQHLEKIFTIFFKTEVTFSSLEY